MLPILDVNVALLKGDFKLLRNLVESGTDVNIRDKEDRTALINCCLHDGENWALGSARLLLRHGAKLSLCDKDGRNALIYAIMYRRENLVKLFLDALDCDLTHTDKWNHTALWYAVSSGNITITTMLQDILKKYRLEIESSTKENTAVQVQLKTSQQQHNLYARKYTENQHCKGFSRAKVNRTQYLLPYKTLSASIWEKRLKFYNGTGSGVIRGTTYCPALQYTSKLGTIPSMQEQSSSNHKENVKATSKINQESSQEANWRQELKRMNAILEMQLSSSYCTKAYLLPKSIQRYPTKIKSEMGKIMKDGLKGKERAENRRSSFDAFDVLQTKKFIKSISRRRCSVAVIPLIRFQSSKSSFPSKQEEQTIKS